MPVFGSACLSSTLPGIGFTRGYRSVGRQYVKENSTLDVNQIFNSYLVSGAGQWEMQSKYAD